MKIDQVQLATIIAALRFWQSEIERNGIPGNQYDIATGGDEFMALDEHEIDILCEELNCSSSKIDVVRKPQLAFIRQVAHLLKDEEEDADGEVFTWENDDAWETLHSLINEARSLLAQIPGHIPPE